MVRSTQAIGIDVSPSLMPLLAQDGRANMTGILPKKAEEYGLFGLVTKQSIQNGRHPLPSAVLSEAEGRDPLSPVKGRLLRSRMTGSRHDESGHFVTGA
jgi:hypothetical protein